MGFTTFGLAGPIVKGVHDAGYTTPTEIQHKAIPAVIEGRDIIGCAPTGTGKTAAFILPILHRLLERSENRRAPRAPRALILAPTRELTRQIAESARAYGRSTRFRACPIYGGVDIREQIRRLKRGADIVAATPGRLIDHCNRKTIDLSRVEILVLDEADRMYDMGFIDDMRRIIAQTPSSRQTLLFSATMSKHIRELVAEIQRTPALIQIGAPGSPTASVTQRFYAISPGRKNDLLAHILNTESIESMLVFSRTRIGADSIATWLGKNGFNSAALHANRTQSQRRRALEGFKQGRYKVLVATDIAARGIDVNGISHVVNFDAPAFAEDYVHRIGRTGRAEARGAAITFVTGRERKHVRGIERLTGARCTVAEYPGFTDPEARAQFKSSAPRTKAGYAKGRTRQRARFGKRAPISFSR